jgi:hypothetical protein
MTMVIVKSWPVPLRLTVCVLLTALLLSVMINVSGMGPPVPGAKLTLMVQELRAAAESPQLLLWL